MSKDQRKGNPLAGHDSRTAPVLQKGGEEMARGKSALGKTTYED